MIYRILTAFVVMGFLASASWSDGHSNSPSIDTALAQVGDTTITVGHVVVAIEFATPEQKEMSPEKMFASLLDQLIQQEQLVQQIGTASVLAQLQMDNERRSLLATEMIERIIDGLFVSEEEIRAAYDSRFGGVDAAREYNASHILVETEEEALSILAALEGGFDFGEAARNNSIGPSGPTGGRLGWFGSGRMVPEFEAAVGELEVGALSAPVKTQFGWHIIKLLDTRIPNVPTLDDAREGLEREIMQMRFNEALMKAFDKVPVERFDVDEIDPTMIVNALIPDPMNE